MHSDRIRVGIVGLNPHWGWARAAHVPALRALPDFEITAVCTTRQESADAAARHFNIPHAFDDPTTLAQHPEVDLVAVTVKVPDHERPVLAALDAGKHVYCEWPLGRTTAEAETMLERARHANVRHMVGLQAHGSPVINYVRDLIADGYVGRVLSATMLASSPVFGAATNREGAYIARRDSGATLLSIHGGHSIEAFCLCLGEFRDLSSVVARQFDETTIAETGERLAKDSPDQIAVAGVLESGAVATIHVQGGTMRATGLWLEINGMDGDLILSSPAGGVQISELTLRGARKEHTAASPLPEMAVPDHYREVPAAVPAGPALNVAQQYARLAESIRNGTPAMPDFEAAVVRHRMLDAIQRAANTGARVRA
jgi:predicted dehydrogenase